MTMIPVFPGDAVVIFFSCSAVHFFLSSCGYLFFCVRVGVFFGRHCMSRFSFYRTAPTTATRVAAAASTKTGARVTAADETDAFSPSLTSVSTWGALVILPEGVTTTSFCPVITTSASSTLSSLAAFERVSG